MDGDGDVWFLWYLAPSGVDDTLHGFKNSWKWRVERPSGCLFTSLQSACRVLHDIVGYQCDKEERRGRQTDQEHECRIVGGEK